LDVERADDGDARVHQFGHVLMPLGVPAAGNIRVGDLVDDHDGRLALQDVVQAHLLDIDATIFDAPARHDFDAVQQRGGLGSTVRLDESHDDVDPALPERPRFFQHAIGFADACREADVQLQPSTLAAFDQLQEVPGTAMGCVVRHGCLTDGTTRTTQPAMQHSIKMRADTRAAQWPARCTGFCPMRLLRIVPSPPTSLQPPPGDDRDRGSVQVRGLVAVIAAALLGIGAIIAIWWTTNAETRELRALPDDCRLPLYHRTVDDLRTICDPAAPRSLRDFCRRQAEVASKFLECDANPACQILIRRHLAQPRR
jgi:hypothetical protein